MEGIQVTTAEIEAMWLQSGLQVTYLSSAVPHSKQRCAKLIQFLNHASSRLPLNQCDLL